MTINTWWSHEGRSWLGHETVLLCPPSCHLKPKGANWGMKQSKLVRFITIGSIPVEIGSVCRSKLCSSEVSRQFHNLSADDLDCYALPKSSKDNEVSSIWPSYTWVVTYFINNILVKLPMRCNGINKKHILILFDLRFRCKRNNRLCQKIEFCLVCEHLW